MPVPAMCQASASAKGWENGKITTARALLFFPPSNSVSFVWDESDGNIEKKGLDELYKHLECDYKGINL
ncbi:unnamed protein product [Caenorhabditis auriculariae]|uniref:Uncharacterized protein n=1 Tax=Caenorhabditis auriculariae TaxID=2777116 RepID=A0A8S1GWA1_9PELO|nr:unnamed protein product [Caenorhabditis auriculariae]